MLNLILFSTFLTQHYIFEIYRVWAVASCCCIILHCSIDRTLLFCRLGVPGVALMPINFLIRELSTVYTRRNKISPLSLPRSHKPSKEEEWDLFLILSNSVCSVSEESEHSERMSAVNLKHNSQNDASISWKIWFQVSCHYIRVMLSFFFFLKKVIFQNQNKLFRKKKRKALH